MPDADQLTVILGIAQLVAVIVSVLYLGRQVTGEKVAAGFQAYSQVNQAYTAHLWRAAEDPSLNCIWKPQDDARMKELDAAQAAGAWGAWSAMSDHEKLCYRYTRAALELFEQAWEVKRRDLIGEDTWQKWRAALGVWKTTCYYDYVIEDTAPRLIAGFVTEIKTVSVARGPAQAAAIEQQASSRSAPS